MGGHAQIMALNAVSDLPWMGLDGLTALKIRQVDRYAIAGAAVDTHDAKHSPTPVPNPTFPWMRKRPKPDSATAHKPKHLDVGGKSPGHPALACAATPFGVNWMVGVEGDFKG